MGLIEKVKQHGTASKNFGDIASDIEFFLNQSSIEADELSAFSEGIHERVDIFEGQEPLMQQRFMEKAKRDISTTMGTQRIGKTQKRLVVDI
jgi:hypothetical protein